MKKFDVIVIGSGGGSKIVSPAAASGYKVAVIERDKFGGTCLNRGCIPSKMLIWPADLVTMIKEIHKHEISASVQKIDFKKIIEHISKTVDHDSESIPSGYAKNKNITVFKGDAKFVENHVVEVNGERITAEKIFVAVGARPTIPPIPGLEKTPFMTSTEALRNTSLPKKLIVIGGGYIGCELGHAYGALGSEVCFLVRSHLLSKEDNEVRKEFESVFAKRHNILFECDVKRVQYTSDTFTVSIVHEGKEQQVTGDALLIATGVTPNTDTLGLEHTRIKVAKNGFIEVDAHLRTSVPGVWALGDCIGKYLFRHSVNFEAEYLVRTLFTQHTDEPIEYSPVPHAVFTYPEIAGVGLTEEELEHENTPYVVGKAAYIKSGMGMARRSEHGFVKVLFHKRTKRLLGAHIIGDEAATMVHTLIMAMTLEATHDDMMRMIYIHPALPEIVRNAVRNVIWQ